MDRHYLATLRWLVLACFLPIAKSSVAQQWTDGYNPHTRHINDIEITSDHKMFLFGGYPPELGKDRMIYRVTDYGQNWFNWEVVGSGADYCVTDVEYLNNDTAVAVGENGTIIRTFDGGLVWDSLYTDTARYISSVDFVGHNFGLIAGGDSVGQIQTVKRSLDGGSSWITVRDVSGAYLRSLHCVDVDKAFAVGDDGTVIKTTDGGDNWSTVAVPLNRQFQHVYFLDSDVGIIVGGDILIRTILRSDDGGDTWATIMDEAGGMLNDVYFLDALNGYAVGNHGQYLTTSDGGSSWTPQVVPNMTFDDHLYSVHFQSDRFGMMCGTFGRYFMYTDFDVPQVQTGDVLLESSGTVNFFGLVNTGGGNASTYFVYSTDPNLANADSTSAFMMNTTSSVPITQSTWTLLPNTTYYYTCKSGHLMGSATGDTLSFFTDFGTGVVIATDEPSNITTSSVELNGHVQNLAQPSTVWFEYNPYGGNTVIVAGTPSSISDGGYYDISSALGGLTPNTTYRYRLRVESGQTVFYSQYRQFYTGVESTVTTLAASNVSFNTATFNGYVEQLHLPTDLSFYYFPSAQGGGQSQLVAATPSLVSDENGYTITANVSGLTPNTYYSCQLMGQNPYGILPSSPVQFYTGIEDAAITDPATGVTANSAYLNGTCVELDAYPGTPYFEYFKLLGDTLTVPAWPQNVAGPQEESVQAFVDDLDQDTVYGFRLKLIDNNGFTYFGKTRQIHTGGNPIPNHDFEDWSPVSVIKPDNWFNVMGPVEQVSPGYLGNHALKLEFGGDSQIGAIMNGALSDADNGLNFLGGQPYSSRPDTLSGMFKYDLAQGDSATVIIMFRKNGQPISEQRFLISGSSPSTFVKHDFPIVFDSPDNPDSVIIGVMTVNLFASVWPQVGDWIIVDELKFNGSYPDVPNSGFEDWTPFTFNHLDSWNYVDMENNGFFQAPENGVVRRSAIAQEGSYAVEIHNLDIGEASGMASSGGHFIGGMMNTAPNGFVGSGGRPSFVIHHRPQALHGYYKFFPENQDTLVVRCDIFESGSMYSSQAVLFITEPALEFTPFTLDLDGLGSSLTADSASIFVGTANNLAYGASWAVVDNLRFDGFTETFEIIVGKEDEIVESAPSIAVFPNPGFNTMNIKASGDWESDCHLHVYDTFGRNVTSQKVPRSKHELSVTINAEDLISGIYFIRLSDGKTDISTIWIKQ